MNTFGRILRLTTWGESHGEAIGAVLDGFPSNFKLDLSEVQKEVSLRSPGQSHYTSPRNETDTVEFLSGIYNGVTLGSPIAFVICNQDKRSRDYSEMQSIYRPGHADYTYQKKYGIRDYRGGGRASARETALRVVAGAIARQWLRAQGVDIMAYTDSIGCLHRQNTLDKYPYSIQELQAHRSTLLRNPDLTFSALMLQEIEHCRSIGDSIGGVIACIATGLSVGLGEPIYDKLESRLASAMLSINATKGFEIGDGFDLSSMYGSTANDPMTGEEEHDGSPFKSNHSGGILGGISTGQVLRMRIAFKPTPSISMPQSTINQDGESCTLSVHGRHDPCVIPRALPVVEAMCALVLMDFYLLSKTN